LALEDCEFVLLQTDQVQEAVDLGFLFVLELLVEFSEAWVAVMRRTSGGEGDAAPTCSGVCATTVTTLLHFAWCWGRRIIDVEVVY